MYHDLYIHSNEHKTQFQQATMELPQLTVMEGAKVCLKKRSLCQSCLNLAAVGAGEGEAVEQQVLGI